MNKFLVLAVFHDGTNVTTHYSKYEMSDTSLAEDEKDKIIFSISEGESGIGRNNLHEVFVLQSSIIYPKIVAHWNAEDIHGEDENDEERLCA